MSLVGCYSWYFYRWMRNIAVVSIVILYTCIAYRSFFFQNCAALLPPVEHRPRLLESLLHFPKSSSLKSKTLWTTCHHFFFCLRNQLSLFPTQFVIDLQNLFCNYLEACMIAPFRRRGQKQALQSSATSRQWVFSFGDKWSALSVFFGSIICCRLGYRKPSALSPRLTLSGLAFPSSPGFLRRLGPFLPLLHDAAGISS